MAVSMRVWVVIMMVCYKLHYIYMDTKNYHTLHYTLDIALDTFVTQNAPDILDTPVGLNFVTNPQYHTAKPRR